MATQQIGLEASMETKSAVQLVWVCLNGNGLEAKQRVLVKKERWLAAALYLTNKMRVQYVHKHAIVHTCAGACSVFVRPSGGCLFSMSVVSCML